MQNGPITNQTFVIELTPQGRGAVAVVLVTGQNATQIVDELFASSSKRRLASTPLGRILFGRWGRADGEELVVFRRAEDELEIHCHGGLAAVRSILGDLVQRGCRRLTWQEWLRQNATDPIHAAAQIALAAAPTARTAAILLDQFNGALSAAVQSIIEAAAIGDWQRAAKAIDAILMFRNVGEHLTAPWRVVLAGEPNVGKSSLINALAGYERAIVAPTPGTTRDVVTIETAIEGWPVELADTAGLRTAENEIELAGITLATDALAAADLVLMVRDVSADDAKPQALPLARVIHVANKIDLVEDRSAIAGNAVITSAVTLEGIDTLIGAIAKMLVPLAPPDGSAVPFHPSHFAALEAACIAVEKRKTEAVRRALQALLPV